MEQIAIFQFLSPASHLFYFQYSVFLVHNSCLAFSDSAGRLHLKGSCLKYKCPRLPRSVWIHSPLEHLCAQSFCHVQFSCSHLKPLLRGLLNNSDQLLSWIGGCRADSQQMGMWHKHHTVCHSVYVILQHKLNWYEVFSKDAYTDTFCNFYYRHYYYFSLRIIKVTAFLFVCTNFPTGGH